MKHINARHTHTQQHTLSSPPNALRYSEQIQASTFCHQSVTTATSQCLGEWGEWSHLQSGTVYAFFR